MVAIVGLVSVALLLGILLLMRSSRATRKGTDAEKCSKSQRRRTPSAGSACHGVELMPGAGSAS